MADLQSLQLELEKFGLTKKQAQIYLLLVQHGELRIQEIAHLAKLPRTSVYDCLRVLFELGIAEEIIENSYKKVRPYSIGTMRHGLDEKVLQLQRLVRDLEVLEKDLSTKVSKRAKPATQIRYYKARSGARQLYWNTLKATDTVYVMSDWGRGRYVGMKFYATFVAESRSRHIRERVLINPTPVTLESIRTYTFPGSIISRTRLEDIRALPVSEVKITGDTLMYDNIYATVYLQELAINGFEIENPQFVKTQRAIFETLWERAKPITKLL